jgi:hypothetical protein
MNKALDPNLIVPQKFVLVVGNARSGTTIVGAIIDSHARMICANETTASANFWRGWNRQQIVNEVVANSAANYTAGRPSEGYSYAIETDDKHDGGIVVIGDRVWNPALLLMAGQRALLSNLEQVMGCSVVLVHCVRNPFDVIATMHRRSGASLRDRLRWYTMHCEAIQIIIERSFPMLLIRHEDLIAEPGVVCQELFGWLGHSTSNEHLARIQSRLSAQRHRSRATVGWSPEVVQEISELTSRFTYLAGYNLED